MCLFCYERLIGSCELHRNQLEKIERSQSGNLSFFLCLVLFTKELNLWFQSGDVAAHYFVFLFTILHFMFCASFSHSDPVSSTTSDDDENEFYDAQELSEADGMFSLKISPTRSINDINGGSSSESEELNSCETEPQSNTLLQVPIFKYFFFVCKCITSFFGQQITVDRTQLFENT